ncbi:hypothetical protein [Flavobacterium sp.]|uniref:hypothetical protein n=1 Tax=Flavobacterium sp. TaxID=239 RepID=UPI00286A437E|nr:hypothetical protein [Flavobacterium sp.]
MNNPESVKLEVFTIVLKPVEDYPNNSFEDLISKINGIDVSQELFEQFTQLFINHIDLGYTEIRNKAFTLSTNAYDYGFDITNHSIWGVLKGGPKGNGKTKSPLENREDEEDLSGDVINDKYFFCLHFPPDSYSGFLFFHIYGGESIRKEFIQHITDLFKVTRCYNKAVCHPVLPNSVRDEFKNNSRVVGLTYNTNVLSSAMTQDSEFANLCANYNIEITIKPAGQNIVSSERVGIMNRVLSGLKFNNLPLSNSRKKKVALENLSSNKTSTFELDVQDVMPRIYLDGKVPLDIYGTPNFVNLKIFCDELLRELIAGQYTRIARR